MPTKHHEQIEYLVGQEHNLVDLLQTPEIRELLREAVAAGAAQALLTMADGSTVCGEEGQDLPAPPGEIGTPLYLEGENIGQLIVRGGDSRLLSGISAMLLSAITVVLNNNLKRMLTAEMHTSLVTRTYDELLAKNLELSASEARYRELAQSLERKVQERTEALGIANARLLQQEKLVSIGQLAAGVAHEINNPIGFITSNLATLKKYAGRFEEMLDWYREQTATSPLITAGAAVKEQELKLDLVRSDIGDLLAQSLAGAERVKKIVADLKGVSHVDEVLDRDFDLAVEVERILSLLRPQIPADAEIVLTIERTPKIPGSGALFCQALVNMIQNACQARPVGLKLTIAARCENGLVRFSIADNGPGVPPELRNRIFDPFFTTRDVGAGTGMGLAVVYDIVKKSGGTIAIGDAPGGGALFVIEFPLGPKGGA
jgi:signal transduction histidine kinase